MRVSRRRMLGLMGLGAAGAGLVACGTRVAVPGLSGGGGQATPDDPAAEPWQARIDGLRRLSAGTLLLEQQLDPQIRTDRWGPWANRLMLATSADGLEWARTGVILANYCDVPSVLVHDGIVHFYFVSFTTGMRNTIARASSTDLVNWEVAATTIAGLGPDATSAVDPTAVVTDDGRVRLYFTAFPGPGGKPCTFSGISDDGLAFTLEEGIRYEAETPVLDPSVLRTGAGWLYFAGGGGSVGKPNYAGFSPDGLDFEELEAPSAPGLILANGVDTDGGYRYYAFEQGPGVALSGIQSLFSANGRDWAVEEGRRLAPADSPYESNGVKDPAVARLGGAGYLMAYVTQNPIYEGLPKENQGQPPGPK